jgi:hypothetical protein
MFNCSSDFETTLPVLSRVRAGRQSLNCVGMLGKVPMSCPVSSSKDAEWSLAYVEAACWLAPQFYRSHEMIGPVWAHKHTPHNLLGRGRRLRNRRQHGRRGPSPCHSGKADK